MQKVEEKHREDPVGYPDFTKPITIVGCIIEAIPIDIKAQTLGTVAIDIKSQTLGQVDVNIKASAVTLNVNIAASAVTLSVNIFAGLQDIAAFRPIINTDAEDELHGWIVTSGTIESNTAQVYAGYKSWMAPAEAEESEMEQVGLKGIPTSDIEEFSVMFLFQLTADQWVEVEVYYTDGTSDVSELWATAPPIWKKLDVTTTAGKYITSLRIAFHQDVGWICADTIVLRLKTQLYVGTAPTVNLNVSIQESIVTLDINIAASAVTLNVDIKAQTVDLNIKTSGGANIIIDRLTVGAYTERRSTISNNGAVLGRVAKTGNERKGKFFPRGCRGFINTIDVYCRDNAAAGGTITVYISPHPSMGYVASATVTIPAGGGDAWRSATFNRMWNYDSLFTFYLCSNINAVVAYDVGIPYDAYDSADSGATWTHDNARAHVRVIMKGETVGDVPVSGTLNVVEIPAGSSEVDGLSQECPADTETTLVTVDGAGTCDCVWYIVAAAASSDDVILRVYCDGTLAFNRSPEFLNTWGLAASTPKITLVLYAADGACTILLSKIFSFRRQLRVTALTPAGVAVTARALVYPNLIK